MSSWYFYVSIFFLTPKNFNLLYCSFLILLFFITCIARGEDANERGWIGYIRKEIGGKRYKCIKFFIYFRLHVDFNRLLQKKGI